MHHIITNIERVRLLWKDFNAVAIRKTRFGKGIRPPSRAVKQCAFDRLRRTAIDIKHDGFYRLARLIFLKPVTARKACFNRDVKRGRVIIINALYGARARIRFKRRVAVLGKAHERMVLHEGRVFSGIPASENERQLHLRVAGQDEPVVIAKSQIESRDVAPVSMMPEGLLRNLQESEVIDLIAYLKHLKQVPKKE